MTETRVEWSEVLQGDNSNGYRGWDELQAIEVGQNGDIYLAGSTDSPNFAGQGNEWWSKSTFIARYNVNGDRKWIRVTAHGYDQSVRDIAIAPDGSVYKIFYRDIIKYSQDGEKIWSNRYDLAFNSKSASVNQFGDLVVAGEVYGGSIYLKKVNSDGHETFEKNLTDGPLFTGRSDAGISQLKHLSDGSMVVIGYIRRTKTIPNSNDDFEDFVAKLDSEGEVLWRTVLEEKPYSLHIGKDGRIYTYGVVYDYSVWGNYLNDSFFSIYSASGELVKRKQVHAVSQGINARAVDIITDSHNNIYVVNNESWETGNNGFRIYKYNSEGEKLFHDTYGGPSNENDSKRTLVEGMVIGADDQIIIAGMSDEQLYQVFPSTYIAGSTFNRDIFMVEIDQISGRVSRLYNPFANRHLFSSNQYEIDLLTGQGWVNEGYSYATPLDGNQNVYRFLKSDGSHFYSASDFEKDFLINNPAVNDYTYEGIAFVAHSASSDYFGSKPAVVRYYNVATGSHLYSTSATEQDILNSSEIYQRDGIAWYGEGVSRVAFYADSY